MSSASSPDTESTHRTALRTDRRPVSRTHAAHPLSHALRELSDRGIADRGQQRVAVGEVAISGVRHNPDHARHLAEHDGVRPA